MPRYERCLVVFGFGDLPIMQLATVACRLTVSVAVAFESHELEYLHQSAAQDDRAPDARLTVEIAPARQR